MREKDIRRNVRESYGEAIDRRVAGQGSAIDAVTDMTRGRRLFCFINFKNLIFRSRAA